MRFDKPVFFETVKPGAYDPTTGDYADETIEAIKQYADITNAGAETLKLIYGTIKQGVLVVRIKGHHKQPFDRIRIDGKIYRVDFERKLPDKHVFIASEVQ